MAGIHQIQSNSLKTLRHILIESILKKTSLSPFQKEQILVHSNGMAQWLRQGIAQSMGICANIEFILPTKFIYESFNILLHDDFKSTIENPFAMHFDQDILAWQIFYTLNQENIENPIFKPLKDYLKEDKKEVKKRLLSKILSKIYEQYQSYRSDWLDSWQEGKKILDNENEHWQAHLWQLLNTKPSRASLFKKYIEKLQKIDTENKNDIDKKFKKHIILFGLTGLSKQHMDFFIHYSKFSDVYFFIHNPTHLFWGDFIHAKDEAKITLWKNKKIPQMPTEDNLLALFGTQGRDALNLFYELTENQVFQYHENFIEPSKNTLLNKIKNTIFNLCQPEKENIDKNDFSITFHQNYSPLREVEVLNNILLKELDCDPTLKPRDILILTPDVEKYSPFIDSIFGAYSTHDKRFIPYSIADRKKIKTSLFLRVFKDIISINKIHAHPNQIFSILESPLIQKRFQFNSHQIQQLKNWVNEAGIRWGLSAQHRKILYPELENHAENTWQKGLTRLILGFMMGNSSQTWKNYLPLALAIGLNAKPLGDLFLFIQTLEKWSHIFNENRALKDWKIKIEECINDFFEQPKENKEINDFLFNLGEYIFKSEQSLKLLHKEMYMNQLFSIDFLLDDLLNLLEDSGLKQPFLDGKLIFATFMPMRAIPYRQVYILGLNSDDYPRKNETLSFDLIAQNQRMGDHSRINDDRYMFLEALLAAEEKISFSYIAKNARDNSRKEPSILLEQLQSYIDKYWGKEIIEHLTTLHPAHVFSQKYIQKNELNLFTYSQEWFTQKNDHFTTLHSLKFENKDEETISLKDILNFLKNPTYFFYKKTFLAKFNDKQNYFLKETENFGQESLENYKIRELLFSTLKNSFYKNISLQTALQEFIMIIKNNDLLPWGGQGILYETELNSLGESLIKNLSHIQKIYRKNDFYEIDAEIEIFETLGEKKQLILTASNLKNTSQFIYEKFLQAWLFHIFANANHLNVNTQFLGVVNQEIFTLELQKISRKQAQADFNTILHYFSEAKTRALPVTPKSAIAYLKEANHEPSKKKQKALDCLESEFEKDTPLALAFENAQSIDFSEFSNLSEQIYGQFWACIHPILTRNR